MVNWTTLEAEYPHAPSAYAWYPYLKKHGRKQVQNIWYKGWKEKEQAIFWDEKEKCFKIDPHASQKTNQH